MDPQALTVQAPDGKVIQFPKGMGEAEVNAAMQKMYPAQPGVPRPKGPDMQQVDLATGKPADTVSKLGAGVLKSGAGMIGGISSLLDRVLPRGKDTERGKDIKDIQEFARPSSGAEAVGKMTGDVASMFAPGGLPSRLGRVLGTGAVSGAQGGTVGDIALGAGTAGAGEAIQAGVKALRTSIRGIKDPQLKNLANAFRDALSDLSPNAARRTGDEMRSGAEARSGIEARSGVDQRQGIERRDIERRSGDSGRENMPDDTGALNDLRQRGGRSGSENRSNFDQRVISDRRDIVNRRNPMGDVLDRRMSGERRVSSGPAEQAVANIEEVWSKTPESVRNKPGARNIYNQVMSTIGGGRQEMPPALETKYDMLKRIMDHRAAYHAAFGATAGGLYGEHYGNPVGGALEGAALGISPSLALRGLPALGRSAPALMRPLPPLERSLLGGQQQQ